MKEEKNVRRSVQKFITSVFMAAWLISSIFLAAGCYMVKGVKMSKLVGTYQLTCYSGAEDYIALNEMELYIVIKSDGMGYYTYKDKDTDLHYGQMTCQFTSSEEDSSIYEYVGLTFGEQSTSSHKLAINGKNLNSQQVKWKAIEWGKPLEIDYYIFEIGEPETGACNTPLWHSHYVS